MPSIGLRGEPLEISGRVRALTDGDFVVTTAMGRGTVESMGTTAVLDTGSVQIVVCSRNSEPFDLGCFRSVGIEPTQKKVSDPEVADPLSSGLSRDRASTSCRVMVWE